MILKTTLTILLASTISLVMSQDVVQDDKSTKQKSTQSPANINNDTKPAGASGEPVLVEKENSKNNKRIVTKMVPYLDGNRSPAKKEQSKNNK